jgi:hypothetical protein
VAYELLIEVDLKKIDGSGWCQERDKKYQHITPRRARRITRNRGRGSTDMYNNSSELKLDIRTDP